MVLLNNVSISNITLNELVIAIVGYVIVFIALFSLYGLFRTMPRLINLSLKRGKSKGKGHKLNTKEEEMISGEETAAIAMALQLVFDEMHDEESGVLTIKKISKAYSPWSSKIYAVRNQFNRI